MNISSLFCVLEHYLLFVCVVVASVTHAHASSDASMQRMTTDYHGSAHKGGMTLMYGSHGVITYTTDDLTRLQRINIGDDNDIIFIDSTSSGFVGCTRNKVITSINGIDWNLYTSDSIVDAAILRDSLYILTPTHVVIYSTDGVPKIIKSVMLDSVYSPSHVGVDDDNIYIAVNSWYIVTINKRTTSSAEQLLVNFPFVDRNNTVISGIKCTKSTVYVQSKNIILGNFYITLISASIDHGKKWSLINNGLAYGDCILLANDSVYSIRTRSYEKPELNTYLRLEFVKLDSSHIRTDSLDYTLINTSDTVPERFIFRANYFGQVFRQVRKINDSTLLAVGDGSVIAISTNYGRTWNYLSIFKLQYISQEQMQVLDSNHILFYDGPIVYSSTNGGVTWLPPKYFRCPQINGAKLESFRNEIDGYGVVKFDSYDYGSDNVLETRDYWQTCKIIGRDSLYFLSDTGISTPIYFSNAKLAIPFADKFVQTSDITKNLPNQTVTKSYLVVLDSLLIAKSILPFIDSARSICINRTENGEVYALCLSESGTNVADSNGNSSTYTYRYFVAKLKNDWTWEVVIANAPIRQNLWRRGNAYRYSNSIDNGSASNGSYIYYRNGNKTIYRFNLSSNTIDSLAMPYMFTDLFGNGLHVERGMLNCIGYNQKLYSISESQSVGWDSTDISQYLAAWNPYDYINNTDGTDLLAGIKTAGATRSFIQSLEMSGGLAGYRWVGAICRQKESGITSVDMKDEIPAYIYCSPVYPHPAAGSVNMEVYWDSGFSSEEVSIQMYDLSGQKLPLSRILRVPLDNHSEHVNCNLSGLGRGTYIIKVTLRQSTYYRPFVIN